MNPVTFSRYCRLLSTPAFTLVMFASAFAAPGSLDPTFGNAGYAITQLNDGTQPNYINECNATLLQPDGKIVAAGYSVVAQTGGGYPYYALVRYNADGALDGSFGNGGIVVTSVYGFAYNAVLQHDGKILVAGTAGGTADFTVVRLNADGSTDQTFGVSGVVKVDINSFDEVRAMAVQSDGRVILFGDSGVYNQSSNFAFVRLNTDGSLDTTFGTMGKVYLDNSGVFEVADSVTIQPDGKILYGGKSGSNLVTGRLGKEGSPDPTFGTGGRVISPFGELSSLNLRTDGRFIVTGAGILARYRTEGAIDVSFGNNGSSPANIAIESATIQPNGKIVAVGSNDHVFGVARYNSDGSVDATFGNGGVVTVGYNLSGVNGASLTSVLVQPDGKIVASGYTHRNPYFDNFATLRFEGDPVVNVSGRVTGPDGRGLRNTTVIYSDSFGEHQVTTSSFGYFQFENVMTSQAVTVRVASRTYRFSSKTVQVNDMLSDVDFTGLE